MASAAKHRSRAPGIRREASVHGRGDSGKSLLSASFGGHGTHIGESRINMQQMHALEHLFSTHPAVQATRTVLHGQLLSGGLQVTRAGTRVKLAPSFVAHLEEFWISFARDVVDNFLKFGFSVFAFDEQPEDAIARVAKRLKAQTGRGSTIGTADVPANIVPIVPPLGTYDVAFNASGRSGYSRKYLVYSQVPGMTMEPDEEAFVHVRQAPDATGNINSPVASVYELGSFVSALTDLAYVAEVQRSTPQVTTQLRKPEKQSQLDAGALFFDSESRNVSSGQSTEESQNAAKELEMQAALCRIINELQTTAPHGRDGGDALRRDAANSGMRAPPEYAPKLFVLPKARGRVNGSGHAL